MSDTTAYLAGCATTGVAALVLLVARMGMVSAGPETARARQLDDRLARIEATTPLQSPGADAPNSQKLEYEIRRELDKQQEITKKLEQQLVQQETLSGSLEDQLKTQEEKTQALMSRIQDYQRTVEDMEIDDKIAAASRPARDSAGGATPTTLIFLGAGVVVVLLLGGGGLILCAVLLILHRAVPMPPPVPMSPTSAYRYYDQTFLPPAQVRPRRSTYYDYPPSPYDYTP
jgi:TolA-binding protein